MDTVHEAPVADRPQITGRSHLRGLIVATLAAGLMTFVGAFGTTDLPVLPRLAYWLVIMESGALIGIGASTGVRSWGRLADRPLFEGAAICTLIAFPLTLVATGATALFFDLPAFGLGRGIVMFAAVFVVTGAITAINYATGRTAAAMSGRPDVTPASTEPEVVQPAGDDILKRPRLADRLPLHLRTADILALEAEDHYVRVHTASGSDLLLLRLTDAMAELDDLRGARTHRSWWVARAAVRSAVRGDGRGELLLANGITAPVSRSAMSDLARCGWFGGSVVP